MSPARILILSSGNEVCSQIAEAVLRYYLADLFEIHSAGVEGHGDNIHPLVEQVVAEVRLPLERQRPKAFSEYLGRMHFAYTIIVCPRAEALCPAVPGMGTRLFWPCDFPDLHQGSDEVKLQQLRRLRSDIEQKVVDWLGLEMLEMVRK